MADSLDIPMRALLAAARQKQPALLDFTRKLALAESPSNCKAAVDACAELAAGRVRFLGGRVKLHRQRKSGNILEARFGPKAGAAKDRVLLLGHLDTVYPLGTLEKHPLRLRNGRLHGPGTLDMKAGAAMAFAAVEILLEARLLDREIVLLLNPDEETGSLISRPTTERLALACSAVYVLEPAQGLAYKTARKGIGDWNIQVKGVEAHAGVDFAKGANAILELARAIQTVSSWTDLQRGLTVSVGVAAGGTERNVVPGEAWAQVDVRFTRPADGARIARRFASLKPADPRCALTVTGGVNRPPMRRTPGTARLFRQASALAAELGFVLEEASTGGGSDGNFTSALGIPTLDGMGAVGAGAHNKEEEHILVEHLAPRTALLAGLLARR